MFARAQTEAVGVLTLTVVVVLLTATVGFVVVESVASADSAPSALGDYRFDATATGVAVTHAGGNPAPLSELALLVRGPNGTTSSPFTVGTLTGGGSAFEPGSTWRYAGAPFPVRGVAELDVLVVHRPSETVVDWATVRVGTRATATPTSTPTDTPTSTPTATPTATPEPTATPAPPRVATFEATNPHGREIRVELATDERLADVRVVVRRSSDGSAVATLTRAAFVESGDGPYAYAATTTVKRAGNYRVVLETARAETGPDVGNGRTRRVHVDDGDGDWSDDWWGDGGWWDGDGWWGGDDPEEDDSWWDDWLGGDDHEDWWPW